VTAKLEDFTKIKNEVGKCSLISSQNSDILSQYSTMLIKQIEENKNISINLTSFISEYNEFRDNI
jgi:hypothetical protein